MKLIIIFGPPAVGKMTVGKELAKLTDFKLFHNHMSLELVNQFFEWSTESFKELDKVIRFEIFKAAAKSDLKGLIFTFVWALDKKADEEYVDEICSVFEDVGGSVNFVELKADTSERLIRNKHEDRLEAKPSKRDVVFSEKNLLQADKKNKLNTTEEDFPNKDILKIDNTKLSANEVAAQIKEYFQL